MKRHWWTKLTEETQQQSITSIRTELEMNLAPNATLQVRGRMSVADLSLGAAGGSSKL